MGNLRRAIARSRQVVEYNRERGGLRVTKDPKTNKTILVSEFEKRRKSELYNEQISLLCNMEGAKILSNAAKENPLLIHPIFRTQHAPRDSQVRTLENVIGALVKTHNLDTSVWLWRRDEGEHLGSYLRRLHHHCGGKSAKFADSRVPEWQWSVLRAIDRQAMMTNVAASYVVFEPRVSIVSLTTLFVVGPIQSQNNNKQRSKKKTGSAREPRVIMP